MYCNATLILPRINGRGAAADGGGGEEEEEEEEEGKPKVKAGLNRGKSLLPQ